MKLATRLALVLGLLALTIVYGVRRLEGPGSEGALERLVVARQVAEGHGLTTKVIHPQAVAVLEKREQAWTPGEPMPELYQAPLYAWTTGQILRLLPESVALSVWRDPVATGGGAPPRFGGDLIVFWINWFWQTVLLGLVYLLGQRIFGPRAGVVAALAMATAVGFWGHLLNLGGAVLPAVLVTALGLLIIGFERAHDESDEAEAGGPRALGIYGRVAGVGVLLGLLSLAEYASLWLLPVVLGWLAWRGRRWHRLAQPLVVLVMVAVVAGPWWVRNVGLTGHPLGLAGQALAQKVGDLTAEPSMRQATLDATGVEFSMRKVIGKGLEHLETNLGGGLWTEGAGLLLAMMIAGLLHRFRVPAINRTRWVLVGASLLVVIGAGFTGDRSEVVPVAAWLAPIWIVLGAGFLVLLAESGGRAKWQKWGWLAAVLVLHALPMLRGLAAPGGVPFRFPPYLPHVASVIRVDILARHPGEGAMSDRPAGLAWYGAVEAWNQPVAYRDFLAVHLRVQEMAVLYLTPNRLDEPYFSRLAVPQPGAVAMGSGGGTADWAQVYRGLANRSLPSFFPLPQALPLGSNIFVLVKPDTPGQSTRR